MAVGLGLVQLNVTDLAEARRFYGTALGFPLRSPFGEEGPFEIVLEGAPAVLVYRVDEVAPSRYPDGTGTVLVLRVNDLDACLGRWRAAGVELVPCAWADGDDGVGRCPYGRFIGVRDPSGNVFEVLEAGAGDAGTSS